MLYHFVHLYFLTEFEIIFYIFYIMPYEKTLILDLLKPDDKIPDYNISFSYNLSKCPEYQDRLDRNNRRLWNMCVYYLIAINSFLFLIFCRDLLKNYVAYNENTPASSPKYNTRSALTAFGSGNNLQQTNSKKFEIETVSKKIETREKWFIVHYWKKSEFIAEMCKTLQFIILVAVFEYLFFVSVVNKYKILDTKTLLCSLEKEF